MKKTFLLLTAVVCAAALAGCPPPPPFSAAGSYEGTWSGTETDTAPAKQAQQVSECPLSLTLTQNTSQNGLGAYAVQGTATIDYSCIELPEWIDTPPSSTVQISGVMNENGGLALASGGCGTGLCVVLVLNGQGEDTDNDGVMDSYSGDWGYAILVAGFAPFGFNGTFEVERQ